MIEEKKCRNWLVLEVGMEIDDVEGTKSTAGISPLFVPQNTMDSLDFVK